MSSNYYTVTTTYNGQPCSVEYWPHGNGQHYHGYVTSLKQYRAKVREELGESDLHLFVVTSTGRVQRIQSDADLRSAVQAIPNRGVLAVSALHREHDTSPAISDDDGYEPWYAYESDDESVDSEFIRSDERLRNLVHHFAAHDTSCYYCECSTDDWSGARYTYSSNDDYSICEKCYEELNKSEKRDWSEASAPWNSIVPSYPLSRDGDDETTDEYRQPSDVCHLQYLLTGLGFMPLSATSEMVGSYRNNTQAAVRRFRLKHGVTGGDLTVYDKKTARKLAQVVRSARRNGYYSL